VHDPVLQLDQFALQAQQFLEVEAPVDVEVGGGGVGGLADERVHALVVDLHFQFFVEAVEHVVMQTAFEFCLCRCLFRFHDVSCLAAWRRAG